MSTSIIIPEWSAPTTVKALTTTRYGGYSADPYGSFNLASHVGDSELSVAKNRQYLISEAGLPEPARWLNQVHGTTIIDSNRWQANIEADGMISHSVNHVCAVMTADCLPVLLCNEQGDTVAAVHAGWRGLAAGIINQAIAQFNCAPNTIIAWLGPAIGAEQFTVTDDVFLAFSQTMANADLAFTQTNPGHYLADIYQLARQQLIALGVTKITGGDYCTVSDEQRFFSYRRDGITGRMASMIWIAAK